ncbi:MAG: hypothetical protein AB8H79_06210, partial [Myxococcota bacterium]
IAPPPLDRRSTTAPQRTQALGSGGTGAVVTGFGLLGCLTVAGVGLLGIVLVIVVMIVAATPPTQTYPVSGGGGGVDGDTGGSVVINAPTTPAVAAGGDIGPPTAAHMKASLSAPWSNYSLPISPGVVIFSDERTIVVQYSGTQLGVLAQTWREAIEKETGYSARHDFTTEDLVSLMFEKGNQQMAMAVSPMMGDIVVSVSLTE